MDECQNKAKRKVSVKLLIVDLGTRTSKYKLIFGYEVYSNDELIYELISEYSKDLEENSSNDSDEEYSSIVNEKSLTFH